MKNVSFLYKNLPSPLTERFTCPQSTVFWLGNTATTSSLQQSTALLPPVTSPLGQPTSPVTESSVRGGSRAQQKPRAYHWRDCRIGKTGARTAVSMRYTLLPTPGEQQGTGNWGLPAHSSCVLLVSPPLTWQGHFSIAVTAVPQGAETHQTPWDPQSCALLLLPKDRYGTATKG